jgi:anthranilate phosphoribosyltransferase
MVIHGMDGLDEITTTTSSRVSEVRDGNVLTYELIPQKYGIGLATKEDIQGGDAKVNSVIIEAIFNGEMGPKRDIVLINSAAALYVGKRAGSIEEGIEISKDIIDSGRAMAKVNELREFSNSFVM